MSKDLSPKAPAELTPEMLDRADTIDNTVYELILIFAEKDEDELPWDIEMIGDVRDNIKSTLAEFGIPVRHAFITYDESGNETVCEYEDYSEAQNNKGE